MENTKQESIEKLRGLIKNIDMAMLTTLDNGVLRSRPMSTQEMEPNGELWFFTSRSTHKAEEIARDNRVNVSYASGKSTFVSVSGTASLVNDREKIDELWNPSHKLWFPNGKDDPDLVLLKVDVEQAEYWDFPSGTLVHLYSSLKSMVTGAAPDDSGDSQKLTL